MDDFVSYFKVKKNLANLLTLLILVLALPLGLNLIKQQQVFRSRAAVDPIVFSGQNVENRAGKLVATKPQVTLQLTSPLGPPAGAGTRSVQSDNIQMSLLPKELVKTVYAQGCTDESEFNQRGPCVSCSSAYFCCDSNPDICDVFGAYPGQCDSDPACTGGGSQPPPPPPQQEQCNYPDDYSQRVECTGCRTGIYACWKDQSQTKPFSNQADCDYLCPSSGGSTGGGSPPSNDPQYSTCGSYQVTNPGYDYCNDPANNGGVATGTRYLCDPLTTSQYGDGCYDNPNSGTGSGGGLPPGQQYSTCGTEQVANPGYDYCNDPANNGGVATGTRYLCDPLTTSQYGDGCYDNPNSGVGGQQGQACVENGTQGIWDCHLGNCTCDTSRKAQESACYLNGGNAGPEALAEAGRQCGLAHNGSTECKQWVDPNLITTFGDGCNNPSGTGGGPEQCKYYPAENGLPSGCYKFNGGDASDNNNWSTCTGGCTVPPGGADNTGGTTPPSGGVPSVTEITIPKSGWGGPGNPTAPFKEGETKSVKVVAPGSGHIDVYLMPFFGLSSFYTMNPDTSNRTFNPFNGCGPSGNVNCNDPQCPVAEPGYLEDQCWISAPFGGLIRKPDGFPERYDKNICKPVTCGNNKPSDEWWDPPPWTDADQVAWQKYLVGLSRLQRIYSGPADKFTSWTVPKSDIGGQWFMMVNVHSATNTADNWGPNDVGCAWNRKIYRIKPGGQFGELELNTYILDANGQPQGACNNVSSSPTDNNLPVVDFWIGKNVGGQTAIATRSGSLPTTPSTGTRSPSPGPSTGARSPSPSPGQGGITTTSVKIAETAEGLASAQDLPYTSEPLIANYEFKDKNPGVKTIWVEFTPSSGTPARRSAQIELLGPDPQLRACNIDILDNDVTFNINGFNFGTDIGIIKSGDRTLAITTGGWTDRLIKAFWANAPVGQTFPISVIRKNGQQIDGQCSSISQLAFGGRLFCPQVDKQKEFKADLTIKDVTSSAQPRKESVSIKGGIISNFQTKIVEGAIYKIAIKVDKGLRKVFNINGDRGTININNAILPLGDVCPFPGDGKINSVDYSCLRQQWGPVTANKNCDLNGDGVCNSFEWSWMREFFNQEDAPAP